MIASGPNEQRHTQKYCSAPLPFLAASRGRCAEEAPTAAAGGPRVPLQGEAGAPGHPAHEGEGDEGSPNSVSAFRALHRRRQYSEPQVVRLCPLDMRADRMEPQGRNEDGVDCVFAAVGVGHLARVWACVFYLLRVCASVCVRVCACWSATRSLPVPTTRAS